MLLGWNYLRCQPQGNVGNMINKGRGIKASLVPVVNPHFLVLPYCLFFSVKAVHCAKY